MSPSAATFFYSLSILLLLCISSSAKEATLHFYMHDNVFPPNQTVLMVAGPGAKSTSNPGFGTVSVIDDAITQGPEQWSETLGRGQGTWIVSALDASSLLLTFSAVFQAGEYKGSTISFHGADITSQAVREIAVVGGTGEFRFARGYALIETASFTPASVTLLNFKALGK